MNESEKRIAIVLLEPVWKVAVPLVLGVEKGMRREYPTDLTDALWKLVQPLIPKPKLVGRPQSVERREILNAIFYLVRGGIPWRRFSTTFPHRERSITTLGNGVAMARGRRSRTPCGPGPAMAGRRNSNAAIIDCQT